MKPSSAKLPSLEEIQAEGKRRREARARNASPADPRAWFENVLGVARVYPKQIEMVEAVRDYPQVSTLGCNSCVAAETRITNADTGEGIRIADVVAGMPVWSVYGNRVVRAIAEQPFIKGRAALYEVQLSDGSCFRCTLEHRLLTPSGWCALSRLTVGQSCAVGHSEDEVEMAPIADFARQSWPTYLNNPHSLQSSQCYYKRTWATIASIKYVGESQYYDLHVPETNNYLAEGVFHHNSGKDFTAARLALWWMAYHKDQPAKVIITAPTHRQIGDIVWQELRTAYLNANIDLGGTLYQTPLLRWSEERFILGFSTDKPYQIQGFHCLTPDHEVLTKRGFVPIAEVTTRDEVLSLRLKTNRAYWRPVTATHRYEVRDQWINIYEGKQVSFAVTDEHRFVTKSKPGRRGWTLKPLSEIKSYGFMVRRMCDWKTYCHSGRRGYRMPDVFKEMGFTAMEYASFLGWWVTEGSVSRYRSMKDKREKIFYEVTLWQKKPAGRTIIKQLLSRIPHIEREDSFVISNRKLGGWLVKNCGRYSPVRKLPRAILDAKPELLQVLLDALIAGDGSARSDREGEIFYTTSPLLRDQVQEISIKLSRPATWGINRTSTPLGKTQRECYAVSIPKCVNDHKVLRHKIRREKYTGPVHCISTPDETFLVRRKGKVHWTGNSPNLLIIVSEAHGMEQSHINALWRLNPKRLLMTGNPISEDGEFFESHHGKAPLWRTINIDAWDTPNVIEGQEVVPGLVTLADIERGRQNWGEDNPLFRITFKSEWVDGMGSMVVVPLSWARRAEGATYRPGEVEVVGCDVSAGGQDKTVIWSRKGRVARLLYRASGENTMQTVGILKDYHDHRPFAHFVVDGVGVGIGVVHRLWELGVGAINFQGGASASDSSRFADLSSECWWRMREGYEVGLDVDVDDLLRSEVSSRRYEIQSDKRIKLESKKIMKAKGRSSPDTGDGLSMTFYLDWQLDGDHLTAGSDVDTERGMPEEMAFGEQYDRTLASVARGSDLAPMHGSRWGPLRKGHRR